MLPRSIMFSFRAFASVAVLALAMPGIATADEDGPRLDIPFGVSPHAVVERMLEMAGVTREDYIVDLGSGDGRIPIAAARIYGARGLGVDLDPVRIEESNENAEKAGVTDLVVFREENMFDTDLRDATVLTLYVTRPMNLKLRPRILEQMRPGTRVVSNNFDMAEWVPDAQDQVDYFSVYLWYVPARIEGRWQIAYGAAGETMEVEFRQSFQSISGTATIDGAPVSLQNARLKGGEVSFVVERDGIRKLFRGKVDGDRIVALDTEGAGDVKVVRDWRGARSS